MALALKGRMEKYLYPSTYLPLEIDTIVSR